MAYLFAPVTRTVNESVGDSLANAGEDIQGLRYRPRLEDRVDVHRHPRTRRLRQGPLELIKDLGVFPNFSRRIKSCGHRVVTHCK